MKGYGQQSLVSQQDDWPARLALEVFGQLRAQMEGAAY